MSLNEVQTLQRAQLEIKQDAGALSDSERWRLKVLKQDDPLPSHRLSLGGRMATALEFKRLAARPPHENVAVDEPVALGSVSGDETKTLLRAGSATSVGAFQSLDPSREYQPVRRPLDVLDLVRLGSTTEGAVPYMRQTTYTSAAVEVAEATSTTTGTKPEATLPFERVDSPVEEITSWVPATRRALEDVEEMRGIIDEQLLFDARRRLEAQALAGNGTSPNLRGLDNTTGVQSQAKGADSVPLALAKGLALVMNAGFAPTACVLNPDDWVDGVSVILTNGGSSLGAVLEVPVVKSASVAAGIGYVGDWQQLVIWLRSTEVFVSIAHSDYFTRNLVAVLGEIRAAIGVLAPAAFARVTGL